MRGWLASALTTTLGAALGLVYLGAWVYIQVTGGWLLRVAPPASGSWGFIVYDVAQGADILFFFAGLWLLSNRTGRRHVARCMWLIVMLPGVYPVSCYGQFGPEKCPPSSSRGARSSPPGSASSPSPGGRERVRHRRATGDHPARASGADRSGCPGRSGLRSRTRAGAEAAA